MPSSTGVEAQLWDLKSVDLITGSASDFLVLSGIKQLASLCVSSLSSNVRTNCSHCMGLGQREAQGCWVLLLLVWLFSNPASRTTLLLSLNFSFRQCEIHSAGLLSYFFTFCISQLRDGAKSFVIPDCSHCGGAGSLPAQLVKRFPPALLPFAVPSQSLTFSMHPWEHSGCTAQDAQLDVFH